MCAIGAPVNNFLKRKRREAAYECGQRIYIRYSNGVETTYSYKKETHLLDAIKTTSKKGSLYQNIKYDFTKAGNIERYTNDCLSDSNSGNYKTWQEYGYDSLYQLTYVHGETEFNRYGLSSPEHFSEYEQTFSFDRLGNMKTKKSSEVTVTGSKKGDDLNYEFDYEVEEGCAHRYSRIGTRYYKYDEVGNLLAEQTGAFGTEDDDNLYKIEELKEKTYGMNEGWGVFNKDETAEGSGIHHRKTDRRTYEWNAENQLVETSDEAITVGYTYGADGKRASKYTHNSETLYFNDYWVWHIDNATKDRGGKVTKNIYLGTERLASRIGSYKPYAGEENENTFFYHSDHLGSAQLVTDCNGDEYQRIEYTPYGETWIDLKTQISLIAKLPYKFSAKELDEETGLYYYGARYLDPKYSRWISADPAMNTGEYFPVAPIDDEAKKHNQNLPGMGGVFNHINSNLYHYAGNNPVRYIDSDGNDFVPHEIQQKIKTLTMLKVIAEQIKRTDCASGVKLYQTEKRNCCFARACLVANELRQYGYEVVYTYVRNPRNGTSFPYHVAAAVKTQDGELYVIDPIFRKGFYLNKDWVSMQEPEKTNPGNFPKKGVLYKGHYECYEVLNEYRRYLERTGKSEEEVSLYSFCQKLIEHYYETGDVNLND